MAVAKYSIGLVGLLALGLVFTPVKALAAASQPSGITISPFETNIQINPGDGVDSFNLTLTNHTNSLQELDLSTRDFGSLNDTGGVFLEGSNSKYAEQYGLVNWLELSTDTVVLTAGESRQVVVSVDNRTSLAPGGHYGAVVAAVNSLGSQNGTHVLINAQLLSLILVNKVGGEHFAMNLNSVSPNGNWFHLPNTVMLRFQNPGNVQVVPRGLVKLVSPSGEVLSQGIINQASEFVLPESFENIYVPLTTLNKALTLPGAYKIEVQYRYDGISVYSHTSVLVHFIDLGDYLLLAVILIVIYKLLKRQKKSRKKTAKTD